MELKKIYKISMDFLLPLFCAPVVIFAGSALIITIMASPFVFCYMSIKRRLMSWHL